jgi:Cobalamin biosynthesis protein CobT VWA domain
MSKMVLPMELYAAARETCLRLYVANGGDKLAKWTIQPYPGTAAIACNRPAWAWGPPSFTLCMPSFPLDVRLPRWKADLVAAYTVHELLHALWTDWDVVKQSKIEGLGSLVNAIEDNRIEGRASRGDLIQVSEARRLLEALNDHITTRALGTKGFALDAPEQFSFVLNLVLFREKLGYRSTFPANWRARVNPAWLPLFDHALARFDALGSTGDALALARELKALAAKTPKAKPKPATPPPPQGKPQGEPQPAAMPREKEIVEGEGEGEGKGEGEGEGEGDKGQKSPPTAKGEGEDAKRDGEPEAVPGASKGQGEPAEPAEPDDKPEPADAKSGDANRAGRGAVDMTDATQEYNEASLDDLARDAAKDKGKSLELVQMLARDASIMLNVPMLQNAECKNGGDPKLAGAAIASPAKLRRHLTLAVKSPERVAIERRQTSGRVDLRNLTGIATGAENIFRRRVESEGREAAVTLLLDVSGSMKGSRLDAARAMAVHMGDALKAAGVKFEIAAFDSFNLWTPKPFAKGWANDTRRAVAGLRSAGGTAMLSAMKACAERLLKIGGVSRRILFTLTDGQDDYPAAADAALCAYYQAKGVEIVGIGLMTDVKYPFNGRAVYVPNCASLSTLGLAQLVKTLDEGSPRA